VASNQETQPKEGLFAVLRQWGEAWDLAVPANRQAHWDAHVAFLDDLARSGVLQAAGPFDGDRDVMLLVRAATAEEAEAHLAGDPWTRDGLLRTTRVARWRVVAGLPALFS
jgi:uncharacterized protein YciI